MKHAPHTLDDLTHPLKQLLREHEEFRRICDELTDLLNRLDASGYRATITMKDYAILLRGRETIRHHLNVHLVKEEEIFFPRLEKIVPQGRVKFLYLNYDHEYLRTYFEDFIRTINDYDEDRVPVHLTVKRLVVYGRRIISNLLQHILAEDTVYFEVAESGFTKKELEEMGREMMALEARLRE
jgi:hemerythrin-like domain-containing protein